MSENNENKGWTEWSNHVLKELERLNSNYEELRNEITQTNKELVKTTSMRHDINEINEWKKDFDKIVNEEDLKEMKKCIHRIQKNAETIEQTKKDITYLKNQSQKDKKTIEGLKIFKTKAVTASAIIFFILTTAITVLGWYAK